MVDVEVCGTLTSVTITRDEIRGGHGSVKNHVKDGVEGYNEVYLLDLDVINYCVK